MQEKFIYELTPYMERIQGTPSSKWKYRAKRISTPKHTDMSLYTYSNGTCTLSTKEANVITYGSDVILSFEKFGKTVNKFPRTAPNYFNINEQMTGTSSDFLAITQTQQDIEMTVIRDRGASPTATGIWIFNSTKLYIQIMVDVKVIASTATLDINPYFGDTHVIKIDNDNNAVEHTVVWHIGNKIHTESVGLGIRQCSWVIDRQWIEQVPSGSKYIKGRVVLSTFLEQTLIGSYEYEITVNIPNTQKPSIAKIELRPYTESQFIKDKNALIQGITGVQISVEAYPVFGSEIIQYTYITPAGITLSDSSELIIPMLKMSGQNKQFTVTVKDARGQTCSLTQTADIYAYNTPTIGSTSAYRCTEDMTPDSAGNCAAARATINYSQILGNEATLLCKIYQVNSRMSEQYAQIQSNVRTLIANDLQSGAKYRVAFIAKDDISGEAGQAIAQIALSEQEYIIHFNNDGRGVAIGQTSQGGKMFQIANSWVPYWGDELIPRIVVQTEQPQFKPGLIWLKPVQ